MREVSESSFEMKNIRVKVKLVTEQGRTTTTEGTRQTRWALQDLSTRMSLSERTDVIVSAISGWSKGEVSTSRL